MRLTNCVVRRGGAAPPKASHGQGVARWRAGVRSAAAAQRGAGGRAGATITIAVCGQPLD